MNITAKLIKKETPIVGNGKNGEWKKQNLIFETDGQYPKKICVTVWNKLLDEIVPNLLDNHNYIAYLDIESREYNGNWYTELKAWKIEPVGIEARPKQEPLPTPPPVDFGSEDKDNLPF